MKRTILIALLAVVASAIFAGGGIIASGSPVHAATMDTELTSVPTVAEAVSDGLPVDSPMLHDSGEVQGAICAIVSFAGPWWGVTCFVAAVAYSYIPDPPQTSYPRMPGPFGAAEKVSATLAAEASLNAR